jgi:hypothetical protein
MTIVMKVVQRIWTNTIEGIIDDTPEKIRESEKRKRLEDEDEQEISEEEIEIKKSRKKKKKKLKQEVESFDENNFDDEDEDWDPHGLYRDENDYWNNDFGNYEGNKKKSSQSGREKLKKEKDDVEVQGKKIFR